jgi:hypothetical protein
VLLCGTFLRADEPQAFVPDAHAQPIAAASDAPLRWKSKPLGVTRVVADSAEAAADYAPARGWNKTRLDGQVRQAQAISASDPFSDPFGDRGAVRQASDIELEPTDAEGNRAGASAANGVEELPTPRKSPLRLTPPETTSGQPAFIAQQETTPMPTPGIGELPPGRSMPCDRIYNDRNCCELEANCKAFRERLISDSIRTISLDITPRFEPNLPAEEDEQARQDRLSAAEMFRDWHDKRGNVVARGRMSNLSNGRVIIVDESGAEVARLLLQDLPNDELCWINAWWRLPVECALGVQDVASRNWLPSTYHWHASALCHKPLYFEEVQLERYGHTAGPFRQPFISGAHFFLNIATLPYHMGYQPPHECQYALGYYRPGSCAPWMIPPVPLSLKGAAAEAAAIVGGVYLIP